MQAEQAKAVKSILENSAAARQRLNEFTGRIFRTRGGRIGSGMGAVIEALWGFFLNQILVEKSGHEIELAWMYGHEYNDFACIRRGTEWDPHTRQGELLRVEIKSMIACADESKAHFDRLKKELIGTDLLVVFFWDWVPVPQTDESKFVRVSPQVKDFFVGKALDVADLRDALHTERGGSFVQAGQCPDGCSADSCAHVGEPLNASSKRERLSGPKSARVSQSVSYAANFGGLVRMLKCSSPKARSVFRKICQRNDTAWEFVGFIHRNLPNEEANQYSKEDWSQVALAVGVNEPPRDKSELVQRVRAEGARYRDALRSVS